MAGNEQAISGGAAIEKLKREIGDEIAERGVGRDAEPYEPTVDEAKAMLEAVRKRADGWRNGVGATFTAILASLAIKPGEGFMKYTGDTRTQLMLLLGLSLASGLTALLLLVKAANGPTWLTELVGPDATPGRYLARVAGARRDLESGRWAWAASLTLFCLAVALTWKTGTPPTTP